MVRNELDLKTSDIARYRDAKDIAECNVEELKEKLRIVIKESKQVPAL